MKRCVFARRRGDGGASGHALPSASDDELGGYRARNAASGASHRTPRNARSRREPGWRVAAFLTRMQARLASCFFAN